MVDLGQSYLHHKPHSNFCLLVVWTLINICPHIHSQDEVAKTLYFQENVPAPANIGSLALDGAASGLTYSVLQSSDVVRDLPGRILYSDLFDFQSNGEVIAKRSFDREEKAVYNLVVIESSNIYTVDIVIRDINDNAPRFTEPVKSLLVSETMAVNEQLALLGSAIDPDAGTNSTQRYEIIGGPEGVFRLEVKPVGISDLSATLKLNATLDYETQRSYSFIVRAFDGPGLSGDLRLNITVEDVNDVKPEFDISLYRATVAENAGIGYVVLTVNATDEEQGPYGVIEYSLSSSDSSADYRHFAVDSNSGEISVQHALNFLTNPTYRLRVVASNPGAAGMSSSAVVDIQVLNINDQPPDITVDFLYTGLLFENQTVPYNIIRLSIDDPDQEGGNFTVQLANTEGKFDVSKRDRDTFFIILTSELDRETTDLYNLSVTAWDNGTPPMSTRGPSKTISVEVAVADVNDNAPTFSQSSYSLETDEQAPVGAPVGNVTASDSDAGENGRITYTLEPINGSHSNWFTVHSNSGMVQVARENIVCEAGASPRFYIRATDNGQPSKASPRVLVTVRVRERNDDEPIFDESFYSVTKSENDDVGTDVVQVRATDSDCGVSSPVTYSLSANGVTPPPQFTIDANSGIISLATKLDYETARAHEFPVMAVDRGNQVVSVNVKVTVIDANDNHPVFSPVAYAGSVRLDSAVGDIIVVVKATDTDSGALGNVSYFVEGGTGAGLFNINSHSGAVTLGQALPSSPPDSFHLSIMARDGLNSPAVVPANVTIAVVRDAAAAPLFTLNLYQFSIAENSGRDTEVGQVQAAVQGDSTGVVYSIFSGDEAGYFKIEGATGRILSTTVAADRERYAYVILNIRAEKSGIAANAQVNVTITDVNDNEPQFGNSLTELRIPENTPTGERLYTVEALDSDGGDNGVVRYELSRNPQDTFQIHSVSGVLSLLKELDYEVKQQYVIQVRASDSGSPSKSNVLDITVVVVDVNDNPPVFNSSRYELSLSELDSVLTQFGRVFATDRDSGQNGKILYHIQTNQTEFGIYPNTGYLYNEISFSQMERRTPYTLQVVASDSGAQSRSAVTTVIVTIRDENDNSPVFHQSLVELRVLEDALIGREIGEVQASDSDDGDNGRLTFSLSPDFSAFGIHPRTGKIYVNSALDRERIAFYEFAVYVSDAGSPAQTAVAAVNVAVRDINDNAPRFNNIKGGVIHGSIAENSENNTRIVQVTATDPDDGENGRVSYSLNGEHISKFSIDPSDGWIRARVTFDRELRSVYNIRVVARDHGVNPRSLTSTATVRVTVDDKNERPTFPAAYKKISTPENIALGTVVGQVMAEDGDQGENGRVHYTIQQSSAENVFDVNMTSGEIYSALPVDYEKATFHWLIVQAVDSALDSPQATNINVSITVIDKNDNVPTFVRDPKWINIVENTTVGEMIGQVTAYDADSGQNGEVIYEIVSQFPAQPSGMFSINPKTGQISTATTIDYEITSSGVLLVIKATDQALNESERAHSTCSVVVNIEDINDNRPQFKSRNVLNVAEDEVIGYPVVLVVATDADKNNSIRYTITRGDPENKFHLNRDTGELKLNGLLDRETQATYNLTVKAIDTGNPPNYDTQTIYITVTDVNDNRPSFKQREYVASVREEQGTNQQVVSIEATDPDYGANAELTYMIPAGLADDKFTVDASSGMIRTNSSLDREIKSVYTFSAYVHDNAYPKLFDWCTVTVHVTDVNDHTPYFLHSEYYQTVPENLRNGNTSIFQVVAQDGDEGDNSRITYSIINVTGQVTELSDRVHVGNEANKFSIDANTGKIYAQSLDREQMERYTLRVRAVDHGTPPRHNETTVIITVSDTNDNDPVFTNLGANYAASLNETIAPGSFVLAIEATDADKGNNSKISYFISSNGTDGTEGKFHLNMDTGVITTSPTSGHFDREKKSRYMFRVTAQDNAQYDPRTKQTWVEVTILDVNDNAPIFKEVPFQKNITRRASVDSTILTLEATDSDEEGTDNSRIRYSIIDSDIAAEYFKVIPDTGEVKVRRSLLLVNGIQQLRVRATDMGSPQQHTDGFVEIMVGSSSGPQTFKFTQASYTVPLDEDVDNGFQVLHLSATHSNGESGSDIIYTLSTDVADNNNPFSIGQLTGMITVSDASKLNYENTQRYRIVVVAASGDLTDYCTVWINVQDKNDNAPYFVLERKLGFVMESANISTYITQVQALDKDGTSPNNNIEYRLQGDKSNYLNVGSRTGIITLAERVDREVNEQIRVIVTARDGGTPSLTGSAILRVMVQDVNDNPPTFTNLQQHQADNPCMIKEDMQVGEQVYVVSALDLDTAPAVTFGFAAGGNPNNTFNIDHYTGRITLAKEIDHEVVNSYVLGLIANDSVHVVRGNLHVGVIDENDNLPVFNQTLYQIWIEELMPAHSRVIQVQATDRDSGLNGRVRYSLQGARADDFYINQTTGWISNSVEIRYRNNKALINLAIKAVDGGVPELNALAFVQIHVKDINNFAPVFSKQSFSYSIPEDEAIGMNVFSLSASDEDDSPDNKRIQFSIVDGDPDGVFSMENREENIGSVVLKGSLDRETRDSYQLVVMAADGGTPPRNSTAVVNITVADFNDWPPVFSHPDVANDPTTGTPVIKASVPEDYSADGPIVTVVATDRDIGDNAVIEYMITSGNDDGLFQIDQQSGEIRLAASKSLDYELKKQHRMLVRATDTGVPRQSAIVTVLIDVQDVNDNMPKFRPLMFLESVKEKQPYGTEVFTAEAVDADEGPFGVLTYALHGADSVNFKIDPQSGRVITAIEFSYAGQRRYVFNVSATDAGNWTASVQVSVEVTRYDIHKPVFSQSSYKIEIADLSSTYVGMEIGRVKATDKDVAAHGVVIYTLLNDSYYFNVSREEGIIAIKNSLTEKPNREKRSMARSKRSLSSEERLSIKAWSGQPDSQSSVAEVTIIIPEAGAVVAPDENRGLSSSHLIIIIVVVCLAVIFLIIVLVIKTMRNRRNGKREGQPGLTQTDHMDSMGRADTYNRNIPAGMAPPPYGVYPPFGTASHDMTDRSQCASSGRGSAEFEDEGDEEITAINHVPLHVHQRAKIMPDSGIQRDADTISEHSARDHQEYLARLGIDPKKIGGDNKKGLSQSVESMHQFSDEGGGEADPLDISNLYPKLGEDAAEEAGGENNINQMGFGEAPAQIGSLSSVTDPSEEFTGSYNWDYLLNWGPQFQPLADVFAEIARLKDETIPPKRKPVQTVPQSGALRNQPLRMGGPPPIITATPPRVDSNNQREMTQLSSARTSQLTSMVSLPHSPISHESSFSNLAFSPNFTPALSPLATRSPSVSTLQSNGSRSRSTQGSRLGQGHHVLMKPASVTTDSETDYRS